MELNEYLSNFSFSLHPQKRQRPEKIDIILFGTIELKGSQIGIGYCHKIRLVISSFFT